MALTDEQRGPQAAWLRRHRKARYGSGDGGLEALAAELQRRGYERSPTTIKGWESSDERSPIPPEILPILAAIFDEPAPPRVIAATPEGLMLAIRDQAVQISGLIRELEMTRAELAAMSNAVMRALAALGVVPIHAETSSEGEPSVLDSAAQPAGQ